jgi:putative ABC transport system substrate-binding protein
MKRREFILALGGAAAWPLAARAQQERVRRIGVLMGYAENDPEAQIRLTAFKQALLVLGWSEDRNLLIDLRWTSGDVNRASTFAKELVALHPEVIMSNTTPATAAFQRETKTIPIVFTIVSDPVGAGFVESLPRPGGNITGFINLEPTIGGKWLELLKEIAPRVTRVTVMFNPETAPYAEYYLQSLEAAATKYGVKTLTSHVRSENEIEAIISGLGREPGGGLIAMTDGFMTVHRKSVIDLTKQHKVPLMFFVSSGAREDALISYGVDISDILRRSASYVDQILRGAKPAELPVQIPTKFELDVNLKTAKALSLDVPASILFRADEVIE